MLNPKRLALLLKKRALIPCYVFVPKLLSSFELCISIIIFSQFPAYWHASLNIHFLLSNNISPYNISISSRAATSDSSITKATHYIVGFAPFALNTSI